MRRPWLLLAAFWPAQAAAAHALAVAWIGWAASVHGPDGHPWGDLSGAEWLAGLLNPQMMLVSLVAASVLTAAQAVFLLPVRRPAPRSEHRRSLALSLALAGLAIALLAIGLVFAASTAFELFLAVNPLTGSGNALPAVLLATGAVGWATATPLLIAYSRRRRLCRESLLAGIAKGLFAGTVIEAAAVIPLDVMIRRRTGCYCDTGTFYTLTICGAVGLFALGPAVFLPLLAKRRRAYDAAHCNACGYDMSPTPRLERCPECGEPWATAG